MLVGRMYDKQGNYGVMWWTNRSVEQYKLRSDCMVRQYSKFSYFGKHVSKTELCSCNTTEYKITRGNYTTGKEPN